MTLAARVAAVRGAITAACAACGRDPDEVELLPVSKRHPAEAILAAQAAGFTTFGENRVQELADKAMALADAGIRWDLIGSLQTNKVNQLLRVRGLRLLHSLDRVKLADVLQQAWAAAGGALEVLIQVNATPDATKHGVAPADAIALLEHVVHGCPALRPVGVMAMGPLQGDPAPVFGAVAELHEAMRQASGLALPIRSMGMSGDLAAAIAAGSTMVRVGTAIFGQRPPITGG